jgi:hypothetical protein
MTTTTDVPVTARPIIEEDLPFALELVPAIHPGHPDEALVLAYDAWRRAADEAFDWRWPNRPSTKAQLSAKAEAKRALLDAPAATAAGALLKLHHLRLDHAFEHVQPEELAPLFADLDRLAGAPKPLPAMESQGKVYALAQRLAAVNRAYDTAELMGIDCSPYHGKMPGMEALADHFQGQAEQDMDALAEQILEVRATTAEEALILIGLADREFREAREDVEDNPRDIERLFECMDILRRVLPNAAAGLKRGLGRRFSDLGIGRYQSDHYIHDAA